MTTSDKITFLGLVCLIAGMLSHAIITQVPEDEIEYEHYSHNKHRLVFTECMGSSDDSNASEAIENCHNQAGRVVLKEIKGDEDAH